MHFSKKKKEKKKFLVTLNKKKWAGSDEFVPCISQYNSFGLC